jgi:hypothetical protein
MQPDADEIWCAEEMAATFYAAVNLKIKKIETFRGAADPSAPASLTPLARHRALSLTDSIATRRDAGQDFIMAES